MPTDRDEGVILILDDDVHVNERVAETQRLSDKLDLQVLYCMGNIDRYLLPSLLYKGLCRSDEGFDWQKV